MLLIQDERYKRLGHFATQNFFKFIFTSTVSPGECRAGKGHCAKI